MPPRTPPTPPAPSDDTTTSASHNSIVYTPQGSSDKQDSSGDKDSAAFPLSDTADPIADRADVWELFGAAGEPWQESLLYDEAALRQAVAGAEIEPAVSAPAPISRPQPGDTRNVPAEASPENESALPAVQPPEFDFGEFDFGGGFWAGQSALTINPSDVIAPGFMDFDSSALANIDLDLFPQPVPDRGHPTYPDDPNLLSAANENLAEFLMDLESLSRTVPLDNPGHVADPLRPDPAPSYGTLPADAPGAVHTSLDPSSQSWDPSTAFTGGVDPLPIDWQTGTDLGTHHEMPPLRKLDPVTSTPKRAPRDSGRPGGAALLRPLRPWPASAVPLASFSSQPQGLQKQYKRKKFDLQRKGEVNAMRDQGACIRCQIFKEPCSSGEPCERCLEVARQPRVWKAPCFRGKLKETELFRRTDDMVIGRKFEWMDAPRTIYLSHRSHGVQNIHLPIVVQRYVRREGEHTGYFWVDKGQKKSVEPPAFASPTVEQMSDTFEDFVAVHTPAYIHGLLANAPETTLRVFDFALKVRSSYPLVAEALKLWVGSRVIEKGWTMVGSETLGMDKVNDTSSPYHGLNPIPLPLDYQIDWTLIRNLKRRRDKVLRDLKAKVMKRRREDWLEVFLSVFIILNCIEQFTQHDQRYFRRNNPDARFSDFSKMLQFFHSAKTVIYHFHAVNKGFSPFLLDWSSPSVRSSASLDEEAVDFIADLVRDMRLQEPQLTELRSSEAFERDMYWCSQLFFEECHLGKAD